MKVASHRPSIVEEVALVVPVVVVTVSPAVVVLGNIALPLNLAHSFLTVPLEVIRQFNKAKNVLLIIVSIPTLSLQYVRGVKRNSHIAGTP